MIKNPTDKQVVGKIGEDSVCKYLKNKGFTILDRNYLKKWGEIDIVAKKDGIIHFIEVKSVSCEMKKFNVSHETYRPEENVHLYKINRLRKVIQTYILDKQIDEESNWQCDIATVKVDISQRIARVSFIEDIVL